MSAPNGSGVNISRMVADHGPAELAALEGERDTAVSRVLELNGKIAQLRTLMQVSQVA